MWAAVARNPAHPYQAAFDPLWIKPSRFVTNRQPLVLSVLPKFRA